MGEFINEIAKMFSYSFMVRALFIGGIIALCAALLGVILVLKRYSNIGDGLSHVSFGAMAIGITLGEKPLYFSIPIVIVAAYFILRVSENSKIKGDAAIGLISSSAMAIGVIVNTFSAGSNIDLNGYMFGSILAISNEDSLVCIVLGILVLVTFLYLYHYMFSITFDESFAKATGIRIEVYKTILAILTALTIVIGMGIMGTLLMSSLIVFPAVTSMRIFKGFKTVLISSVVVAMLCYFIGMITSYMMAVPSGTTIVLCNLIFFIIATVIGRVLKR